MAIKVSSEVGVLKKVLVHYPDDGIEVVTPGNALQFLYDDIVYLPQMRKEHRLFQNVLEHFTGKGNVVDTYQLLQEVLEQGSKEVRKDILTAIDRYEVFTNALYKRLMELSAEDLTYTLFTGRIRHSEEMVLAPLPNYVFTRDIAVVINDFVLICQASKKARTRESILTRAILYFHPLFKAVRENDGIIDMTKEVDDATIEGGDVMTLTSEYLLVGCSERSTPKAFSILRDRLFEKKAIKNVVRIVIPKQRSSMHIDTLFTFIDKDTVVIYEDTLVNEMIKVTAFGADGERTEYNNLKDFFLQINPSMKFVLCGDGKYPFDEREQWTDGCNLVAVKPGVAIAYGRNLRTAEALKKAGYNVVAADDFLYREPDAKTVEKTIITIPSSELSRARGGPHCMTCPMLRD